MPPSSMNMTRPGAETLNGRRTEYQFNAQRDDVPLGTTVDISENFTPA